ncbi:DinB family protein [Paenibacillus antri]|uniref:DinB family protein n=1 Tax=Paenibacillus antri TaxID=2582848 RepID=A0A5R9G9A4_9BACL|nr:DinB family protein [Paenibacillus antri]TLS52321.1 DinB family protein [Paenibacillus antri]
MKSILFDQLDNVRIQTLQAMEGATEELVDRIPFGFRNNIRWQLGHIYTATEILAFKQSNLPMILPEGFIERFIPGTSPLDDKAKSAPLPTLQQLESLLKEQPKRIREALGNRLNESVPTFTTSTGFGLQTPEQSLRYHMYHEGLHFGIVSVYKRLLSQ